MGGDRLGVLISFVMNIVAGLVIAVRTMIALRITVL